ncbi:MAG: hypothetical protein K6G30_07825 [Acetatifactor sp.]|nr:hypothetical protein [Acetatifactor sp.]
MGNRRVFTSENILAAIFWLACCTYPFLHNTYFVNNFTYYFIMIIFMMSLYVLWGFTGIFSFGQAAFFGAGAYIYGIVSKINPDNSALNILGILMAVLICFSAAAILGMFIYYGHISANFIGIITFCLSLVLQTFMTQTSGPEWQVLGVPLGGYNGLNAIPSISIMGFSFEKNSMYFLCMALAFVFYLIFRKMQHSRIGYMLFGIRENAERSELFGYNTAWISTLVFAAGGAIAGFAGVLYASWGSYVVPSTLGTSISFIGVIIIALAGRYSITGATLFTFIYVWFTRFLASQGSAYSQIVQGILLVLIMLFIPRGIGETVFSLGDILIDKLIPKKKVKKDQVQKEVTRYAD